MDDHAGPSAASGSRWPGSDPLAPRALCAGTCAACVGALAAREAEVLGAATVVTLALVLCLSLRRCGWWLLAVAGALAALPTPAPRPVALAAGPVRLHGRVEAVGHAAHGGTWLLLTDLHGPGRAVRLVVDAETGLLPDDVVRGTGRRIAPGSDEPANARVEAAPEALVRVAAAPTPRRLIAALRLRLEHALRSGCDARTGALLCQLVLGGGPSLPEEVRAAHRATGLAHLLAVSGAHVTMLAALWLALARWRGAASLGPVAGGRGLVCALLLYGLLTQLQAPVVRACAALILAVVGTARGRRPSLAAALALPALLTALVWPEDLLSVSFQLSYAAVLGLGCAGAPRGRGKLARWVVAPLRCSLWAVVTTAPLTLWHFGTLAPWTVVATPLLAPLAGALLALGLAKALVAQVAAAAATCCDLPLRLLAAAYLEGVEAFAALPGAPVFAACRPAAAVLAACALLGGAVLVARRDRWGVLALAAATTLPHFVPLPREQGSRLRLLAVGHGQACLVEAAGTSVLVDCGCLGTPERAAQIARDALLPRRRLDWLVVTHADADHAGGVLRLLQLVAIGNAVLPDELVAAPLGQALRRRGVRLLGVAPAEGIAPLPLLAVSRAALSRAETNESSLWVRLRLGTCEALVPGDASGPGTRAWLTGGAATPADVLVLPHHGRKNDALDELLARIAPHAVLVSNRSDEPRPTAAAQAARLGLPVYATGEIGTVTLHADGAPRIGGERPARL